ncbi:uncharacterized protein LOC129171796 isoform X2 [Dunckerocampus dactyliophorus]|nr:uncharacterized protein LOC129171796 isoform X2 [Dunckerocampus dactyliophorus]
MDNDTILTKSCVNTTIRCSYKHPKTMEKVERCVTFVTTDTNPSDQKKHASVGGIIGFWAMGVVAVLVGFAFLVFVCHYCSWRRTKRKQNVAATFGGYCKHLGTTLRICCISRPDGQGDIGQSHDDNHDSSTDAGNTRTPMLPGADEQLEMQDVQVGNGSSAAY